VNRLAAVFDIELPVVIVINVGPPIAVERGIIKSGHGRH